MRFLVDRCAGVLVADWLRRQGHDVAETRERIADPGDDAILSWAVEEQRVLITADKDFGGLLFRDGQPHCGIVRLPHVPHEQRVRLMETVLARHTADLQRNAVVTVKGTRIRVSHTP